MAQGFFFWFLIILKSKKLAHLYHKSVSGHPYAIKENFKRTQKKQISLWDD